LREIRSGSGDPIENLDAYAATLGYRACHSWLRERNPRRTALHHQIRYLVENDRDFAGRVRPDGGSPPPAPEFTGLRHLPLRDLLRQVLAATGPVRLEPLVSLVADILEIELDRQPVAEPPAAGDPETDLALAIDRRQALQHLWRETQELPLHQRRAVIWSLSEVALLPVCGVATIRATAAAVEMGEREFAELWNRLPLPDSEIAQRLGVERQQVINFRKSARERLARRCRAVISFVCAAVILWRQG
jgi:hypothetical protein